jgi:long-chain fatty acid transport protein
MLMILAQSAFAGGYYYSDSGIIATGRGGAWVAGADAQFAQQYNPAGLIRVDAPTLNVGWSGVSQSISFTRQSADGTFQDPVENGAPPFSIPEIGFATPLGEKFAFAFGFTSPYAPSSSYPQDGPQRYSIVDSGIYYFSIGPSLAWRPHPMFTVGAGVQYQYLELGQSVAITMTGADSPAGDISVSARAFQRFIVNANAGVLFEPHDAVSVGLSVQPGLKFNTRGTGTLDFTGNAFAGLLDQLVYTDEDVTLGGTLPWVVRTGVAVRPVPKLELEGAFVWQGWSSAKEIVIEGVDITVKTSSPLIPEEQRQVADSFSLPAGLTDTFSYRLGGEWQAHERVALRVGGFYETGSVEPSGISVALYDPWKVQVGGGGSVWVIPDRLKLDAALAGQFFQSLEVRDSTVTQVDAGVFPDINPQVVGNGDYRSSGFIVGVAANVAFPKRATK